MKSLTVFCCVALFCLSRTFGTVSDPPSLLRPLVFNPAIEPSVQQALVAKDLKPKEKIDFSYADGKKKFDSVLKGVVVKRKFKLKNMSAKQQTFEFKTSSNITIKPLSGTLEAGESADVEFNLLVSGPDSFNRRSAIYVKNADATTKLAEFSNSWRLPFSDSAERIEYFRLPLVR